MSTLTQTKSGREEFSHLASLEGERLANFFPRRTGTLITSDASVARGVCISSLASPVTTQATKKYPVSPEERRSWAPASYHPLYILDTAGKIMEKTSETIPIIHCGCRRSHFSAVRFQKRQFDHRCNPGVS